MRAVKRNSRDNARQPLDWAEYILQDHNENSVLNFYRKLIHLWQTDIVISEGSLKVRHMSNKGVFDFDRVYKRKRYQIHLDLSGKTVSTLKDDRGNLILTSE